MTNPGDSDEWWKQYGGEGVTPETPSATPQPPVTPPPGQYPTPQPQFPNYPPPQSNPSGYPQQSNPGGYPQQSNPLGYSQSGGYPQPGPSVPPPGYTYPAAYSPYGYAQPARSTNGLAIASLVVSIVGVPAMLLCLFLPVGPIVGLILGIVSLNQVKKSGQQGRGLALGGIWVGAIATVLGIVLLCLLIVGNIHSTT